MSPEFGSTCAIFPIDDVTLDYLRLTGRSDEQVALVEAYAKEQGLWHDAGPTSEPRYSEYLELDLSTVVPSIAGPKRPQDRIDARPTRRRRSAASCPTYVAHREGDAGTASSFPASDPTPQGSTTAPAAATARPTTAPATAARRTRSRSRRPRARPFELDHGAVAIASITSLHQHVEPVGDDRRGAAREERRREGPDRQAVGQDLDGAGLARSSPTTTRRPACGRTSRSWASTSSATAARPASATPARSTRRSPRPINEHDLAVVSVLSGNRNFEGRINPDVKMNYLASPAAGHRLRPGRARWTSTSRPSRWASDDDGKPTSSCGTSGPTPDEVEATIDASIDQRDVHLRLRRRVRRRRALAVAADARGRHLRLGPRVDLRAQAPVLRRA